MARRVAYDDMGETSLVRAEGAHVHDGQNHFDPNALAGGWRLDASAGPSTLMIGIDNSADHLPRAHAHALCQTTCITQSRKSCDVELSSGSWC